MFYSDPKRLDLMIQFDDPASFASLETGEKKNTSFSTVIPSEWVEKWSCLLHVNSEIQILTKQNVRYRDQGFYQARIFSSSWLPCLWLWTHFFVFFWCLMRIGNLLQHMIHVVDDHSIRLNPDYGVCRSRMTCILAFWMTHGNFRKNTHNVYNLEV